MRTAKQENVFQQFNRADRELKLRQ